MIKYKIINEKVTVPDKKTCDCCKKRVNLSNQLEWQEFLHWQMDAGYGSVWGDGNRVHLDLCQKCTHKLLGKYVTIS